MNPSDIAPMVIGIFFIVATAGVVLLRPITKRLGNYLEVLADERRRALTQQPIDRSDTAGLIHALESLEARLGQIEERQEFTDKLLSDRKRDSLKP